MTLLLDERIAEDGASVPTTITVVDGALRVSVGGAMIGELPLAAIDAVMRRYARPLDAAAAAESARGAALDLGDGGVLRMLRHRARYDVIARDFLVLERPGDEPVAELATSIAAALVHLARAALG